MNEGTKQPPTDTEEKVMLPNIPANRVAVLDPRPAAREYEIDQVLTPVRCLGIEVTVPELAEHCSAGNIDPQHTDGQPYTAAIEAAADMVRAGTVPEYDRLVTVRRDADAIGAMAVLGSYRPDLYRVVDPLPMGLTADELGQPDVRDRIRRIAEADTWRAGPPERCTDLYRVTDMEVVHATIHHGSMHDAVRRVSEWLRHGDQAEGWSETVADTASEILRRRVDVNAADVTVQQLTGDLSVAVYEDADLPVAAAYDYAPVVVAANPRYKLPSDTASLHRKLTIAVHPGAAHRIDLKPVWAALREQTGGEWGGSPTIGGSPQGVHTEMPLDELVAVLRQHGLIEKMETSA